MRSQHWFSYVCSHTSVSVTRSNAPSRRFVLTKSLPVAAWAAIPRTPSAGRPSGVGHVRMRFTKFVVAIDVEDKDADTTVVHRVANAGHACIEQAARLLAGAGGAERDEQ